jgi:glycosyltransferase involved in cell wall biosynthesis
MDTAEISSKSTICFVSETVPPYFAGGGKRAFNQAKYLAKRGGRIQLLTTSPVESVDSIQIVALPIPRVQMLNRFGTILRLAIYLAQLPRIVVALQKMKPDFLHCIACCPWSMVVMMAASLLGIPVIAEATLQGVDDPLAIRQSIFGSLRFKVLSNSTHFVSLSPLIENLSDQAGIPKTLRTLIPNGVETSIFKPVSSIDKIELRKKLGLPLDKVLLIFLGILGERKKIAELCEAWAMVSPSLRAESQLLLIGPTVPEEIPYLDRIKSKNKETGIESSVYWGTQVQNTHQWLQASDIFVFASRQEGLPNSVLEAMATGLPTVVATLPGISDYIISHKQNGFEYQNKEQLSSFMTELILNEENLRSTLGAAARETILLRFSQEIVMNAYLELYRKFEKNVQLFKITRRFHGSCVLPPPPTPTALPSALGGSVALGTLAPLVRLRGSLLPDIPTPQSRVAGEVVAGSIFL